MYYFYLGPEKHCVNALPYLQHVLFDGGGGGGWDLGYWNKKMLSFGCVNKLKDLTSICFTFV